MHPSREAFWNSFVSPYVSLKATETRIPMRVVKGDFVAKGSFDVSVPLSSLYTYMFAGLCASLAGVASQAGDADSSRAPGLTSGSWTEPGVLACTLQFTVILKNPAKCPWRWEPDRRNYFFGPPAHLCRHMWLKYGCMCRETHFFFKCLNNPLVSPHCFKFPLVHLCAWGNFLCFWTFSTAAHFVWKL